MFAVNERNNRLRKDLGDMLCGSLGTIDRAMLAASASETNLEIRETTPQISLDSRIDQRPGARQEIPDLSPLFKELLHWSVAACQIPI